MHDCSWRSSAPRLWLGKWVKPSCFGGDGMEVGLVPRWRGLCLVTVVVQGS